MNDKQLSKKERRRLKVEEKRVTEPGKNPEQLVNSSTNKNDDASKSTLTKSTISLPTKGVQLTGQILNQDGVKSKAQLRAERREVQEKQRLQKQAAKDVKESSGPPNIAMPAKSALDATLKVHDINSAKLPKKLVESQQSQRVQLFSHLEKRMGYKPLITYSGIHPSFIQLGAQYAAKTVIGSDARCLALLNTLKLLIEDFQTPQNQEMCRAFEAHLNTNLDHLQKCRPFAVSMTNALRNFKFHLTQVINTATDTEKRKIMLDWVDNYVEDEMVKAVTAISLKICEKITDDDVILTYGHSSVVNKVLIDAKKAGKRFKVIVIDSRPLLEGRQTLNKLVQAGIECTYILITATSFIMNRATKVIVGAHALLNNGYVVARTGTALVALIAKMHMKPVLVCCETFKFCERAQTDSFVYNEIGDSNDLMETSKNNYLSALNLMYDVTPPKYVTGVATELGILPCSSVPVILRLKPTNEII